VHLKGKILEILNSIPSQAWVIFGTFIGSLFTLIGVWTTNQASTKRLKIQFEHDEKVRKESLLRGKLEDLFIVSHKYFNVLVTYHLPFKMVMKGEITFDQAHDLIIEWGNKKDYEPQQVTMLIAMYFPELKQDFEEIMEIQGTLVDVIESYKEQYKTGDIKGNKWFVLFQPKLELLAKKTTQFEEKLTKIKIDKM
jgi:hypothetical protein